MQENPQDFPSCLVMSPILGLIMAKTAVPCRRKEPILNLRNPLGVCYFDFHVYVFLKEILSLAGDIIGCGVDFTTYKAFFTRNGTLIGIELPPIISNCSYMFFV